MPANDVFKPRKWDLTGLRGISDRTLELHFGLYEGYVKNTNLLREQITELNFAPRSASSDSHFTDLGQRLAFEYNGMRLHEYYFENLSVKPIALAEHDPLYDSMASSFGAIETWQKEFCAIATTRGVGWVILAEDSLTGVLSNHWITLHEIGHIVGCNPILVMDVWEHAFLLDYKPAERAKYVEAFFENVDWSVAGGRLRGAKPEALSVAN